jgi:membrane protein insertase Oxa1/YidC/SpoIIIJ
VHNSCANGRAVCGRFSSGTSLRPSLNHNVKQINPVGARRTIFTDVIMPTVQAGIASVHAFTGLPWWATIASMTVFVRVALFPLVRYQVILSRKLTSAMPDINFLTTLLRQRLQKSKHSLKEVVSVLAVFMRGVRASIKIHEVELGKIFFLPFVNAALFCTFVFSIRDMITQKRTYGNGNEESDSTDDDDIETKRNRMSKNVSAADSNSAGLGGDDQLVSLDKDSSIGTVRLDPNLYGGGDGSIAAEAVMWIESLADKDPTRTLPLIAMSLTYLGIELSLLNLNGSRILFFLKDLFLTCFILSAPATTALPAGVFFYWIPSSFLAIVQTLALRSPAVLRLLRIPQVEGAAMAEAAKKAAAIIGSSASSTAAPVLATGTAAAGAAATTAVAATATATAAAPSLAASAVASSTAARAAGVAAAGIYSATKVSPAAPTNTSSSHSKSSDATTDVLAARVNEVLSAPKPLTTAELMKEAASQNFKDFKGDSEATGNGGGSSKSKESNKKP